MVDPLIINNFDEAISPSPHKGFGLMRQVDIESYPGAVKAGRQTTTRAPFALQDTFTANASTDEITLDNSNFTNNFPGEAVVLTTTGTLPAGLSTGTVYFIIDNSDSSSGLATTIANADSETQIDITDTGSGTHTLTVIQPSEMKHSAVDERTGDHFWIDGNGRVWYKFGSTSFRLLHNSGLDDGSDSNPINNASGEGLAISPFSSTNAMYLFAFRNDTIDVVDVFDTSDKENPSWTNGWENLNTGAGSSNSHHAIKGQDEIIYFCDDRYVGSIQEASGQTFDPGTGATYTFNNKALDLPPNEIAEWLEELGSDLLTAGSSFNKIYPWDRTSSSFRLPLSVPERSVERLKNIGGIVYILVGSLGNIYQTQGSYVQKFATIPRQISDNADNLSTGGVSWGGIDAVSGSLLVGASVQTSGNSGVYRIFQDGRMIIDQIPSTGSGQVSSFIAEDEGYDFGYDGGTDVVGTNRYASLEGVVQSSFFRVATKTEKATYSTLEVLIAKPVSSGGVRIGYREDTNSSFTTIDTFNADGTTTLFKNGEIGLTDIENIQVQAEIDDDVELVEIRLIP